MPFWGRSEYFEQVAYFSLQGIDTAEEILLLIIIMVQFSN